MLLAVFIRYTTVTLLDKKKRLEKETCFTKAIFNNGLTRIGVERNQKISQKVSSNFRSNVYWNYLQDCMYIRYHSLDLAFHASQRGEKCTTFIYDIAKT